MEQKSFVLVNGGMNRDLSVSKAGKSSVFENRNVRIESSDNDTFLSITNERGTKRVDGISFTGTLIGWNTLGNYLILFFYNTARIQGRVVEVSSIYRVEYDGENFKAVTIFTGPLGFSPLHPIESIVDYEMESIQKIYWVDGKNVLRFLNFSDEYLTAHLASGTLDDDPVFDFAEDISWFDSTRPSLVLPTCVISKSNTSANPRPNGTAQYFLTYYNRHGQQTGIIYSSPVVYLSPTDRGGAADETNNNAIRLEFSGLDSSYERVRLYQIVRTTADVVSYAYLVAEKTVSDGAAVFIDDGTNLGAVDASSFLYLGSVGVIAETMAQKDGVLFLGNVSSLGNDNTDDLDAIIKQNAFDLSGYIFQDGTDWESKIVEFFLTSETATDAEDCNIPNVYASGYYPYINQLSYTKAQISSFKGGEKYRFALKFFNADGTSSKAFWIGDKVNPYYPLMLRNASVSRPLARCFVPQAIIDQAKANGFVSVQLQVAQATNSDRSVLAQGIVSPAMFNLYERYKKEVFAQSSWIYRPKRSLIPHTHFSGLENPYSRYAELQCAWSSNDFIPTPLYSEDVNGALDPTPEGSDGRNYVTMIGTIKYTGSFGSKYSVTLTIRYYSDSSGSTQTAFY